MLENAFEDDRLLDCYRKVGFAAWISLPVLRALTAPTDRQYQTASNPVMQPCRKDTFFAFAASLRSHLISKWRTAMTPAISNRHFR
jgi:hypothetical protein